MNQRQKDMVDVLRAVQRAASVAKVSVGPGDAMTAFDAFIKEINREAAAINADATEIEAGKAENRWPVPLDEGEARAAMWAAAAHYPDLTAKIASVRAANYLGWCRMVADAAAMTGKMIQAEWYANPHAVDAFLRQVPPDYYARWGL
jgi:hypothetical protein